MKTSLHMAIIAFLLAGTPIAGIPARQVAATPQPAPPPGLFEPLASHIDGSSRYKSHRLWASILKTLYGNSNSIGDDTLDYGRLDTYLQQTLRSYLKTLQATNISILSRDEQLAFWLNFYNAASLAFTLEEFGRINDLDTMQSDKPHHTPQIGVKEFYLAADSPWSQKVFEVNGMPLSLNDIEHNILYRFWDDPMVLYGLSCPAKGCPALPTRPFNGIEVHSQLEASARRFLNKMGNFNISGRTAEVSKLYEWHRDQFEDEAEVTTHLKTITGSRAEPLEEISAYSFDWGIAGKAPEPGWELAPAQLNLETHQEHGIE